MSWKDLLQTANDTKVLPWTGGRTLRDGPRSWTLQGPLPKEHGWLKFRFEGRKAFVNEQTTQEPEVENLTHCVKGYLVGDRIIPDDTRVDPDPRQAAHKAEPVLLIEPGLDRFVRVSAGRVSEDGPLIYKGQEMPLGPEDEVTNAYLDELPSTDHISGVVPALDVAFRLEKWRREEAERIRAELEQKRIEEEARIAKEERRKALVKQMGDGAGRREMAIVDFDTAARSALAVGGATFLDAVNAPRRNEKVVRFRMLNKRFECVCDATTLRIIDSGVCLIDHDSGEKGDTYFTLESLPGVIREAEGLGRLVQFRR